MTYFTQQCSLPMVVVIRHPLQIEKSIELHKICSTFLNRNLCRSDSVMPIRWKKNCIYFGLKTVSSRCMCSKYCAAASNHAQTHFTMRLSLYFVCACGCVDLGGVIFCLFVCLFACAKSQQMKIISKDFSSKSNDWISFFNWMLHM